MARCSMPSSRSSSIETSLRPWRTGDERLRAAVGIAHHEEEVGHEGEVGDRDDAVAGAVGVQVRAIVRTRERSGAARRARADVEAELAHHDAEVEDVDDALARDIGEVAAPKGIALDLRRAGIVDALEGGREAAAVVLDRRLLPQRVQEILGGDAVPADAALDLDRGRRGAVHEGHGALDGLRHAGVAIGDREGDAAREGAGVDERQLQVDRDRRAVEDRDREGALVGVAGVVGADAGNLGVADRERVARATASPGSGRPLPLPSTKHTTSTSSSQLSPAPTTKSTAAPWHAG